MLFQGLPLIFKDEVIFGDEAQLMQSSAQVFLFVEQDYYRHFYFNFNAI